LWQLSSTFAAAMIQYFDSTENGLLELSTLQKKCWVSVSSPTQAEIDQLITQFKVPADTLADILDIDESSRIEVESRYLIMIVKIPVINDDDSHIPFITIPLGILISNDYFITICGRENDILKDFINGKVKKFDMQNHRRFVLQIFLKTSLLYLRDLKEINRITRVVETKINKSVKNHELLKLLEMEKSLVYFSVSLKSNELMMEKLRRSKFSRMAEEEEDLIDDVIVENKQAIELTNIYTNILNGTMDAFASIISNNQNLVMKTLTSITIVLMIPTLVASIFGMNVALPFQNEPWAFIMVIALSIVLSIAGIMYFRRKEMF